MDEYSYEAFANRDEPVPVVSLEGRLDDELSNDEHDDQFEAPADERKRDRMWRQGKTLRDTFKNTKEKVTERNATMQDRLLEKYVSARGV
jgi:hypothetical protein